MMEDLGTVSSIEYGIDGCCPICRKACKGIRGVSVHWRAAHPESYHSYKSEWDTMSTGKTNQRQSGKTTRARWSQEETSALALYESRLVRRGCPTGRRNLNEELAQLMSGRTSEVIKSHRRAESYRDLVDRYEQMGDVPTLREIPREETEEAVSGRVLRSHAPWDREEVEQASMDAVTRVAEACSPGPHPIPSAQKQEWDARPSMQPEAERHRPYLSESDGSDREGAEKDPEWLPSGSDPEQDWDPETRSEDETVTNGELPETGEISTPERGHYPTYRAEYGGEYHWQSPLIEAMLDQAVSAEIDPVLVQVAIENSPENSDGLQRLIDEDLMGLFPPIEKPGLRGRPGHPRRTAQTARAKRREAYARIQALYKASRSRCAQAVLSGRWHSEAPRLAVQTQMAFWRPLFETPSKRDARCPPVNVRPQWAMVDPITVGEVARHLLSLKDGAPGPDNRGRKDLRELSAVSLACRFNLWLLTGKAPRAFKHCITVLIPKTSDGAEPRDFRPISMGSVLCRLYHKLLAERVERHYLIDGSQKAFRKGDGLAENSYILQNVIADRKARCQPTNVAFLDVSKAFDSVSHDSIFLAAASAGIPQPLVEYVRSVYTGSKTRLRVEGEMSQEISVLRGVRQGDPLTWTYRRCVRSRLCPKQWMMSQKRNVMSKKTICPEILKLQ